MKTQCPNCKNVFTVPLEYEDEEVKCRKCDTSFKPEKFKKPPIVIPPALPSTGNFITKLWAKTPAPFRVGFLTTLGVISALTLSLYIYRQISFSRLFLNPESTYPAYSIPSSVQGTGNMLQNLCSLLGELNLAARLKDPFLSEGTRNLLIARLTDNMEFQLNIKWFGRDSKTFEKAINLLRAAIQAEINVLAYERDNPEIWQNGTWYSDKNYMRLMNKSMELRGEARAEIDKLTSKI